MCKFEIFFIDEVPTFLRRLYPDISMYDTENG